jgi:sensor histidine kinase regulating citrate/malate metabolism
VKSESVSKKITECPNKKFYSKKKANLAADLRGKTRIFIDSSSFIGFICVHLRLSAAKNCFSNFLLRHYKITADKREFDNKTDSRFVFFR